MWLACAVHGLHVAYVHTRTHTCIHAQIHMHIYASYSVGCFITFCREPYRCLQYWMELSVLVDLAMQWLSWVTSMATD